MFKSKLQEFCLNRKWGLPTYSSSRDGGPDHAPTFKASILVNGLTFHSPHSSKSSKQAQNQAATLAYNHFLSLHSSSSSGSPSAATISKNNTNDDKLVLNKTEEIPNNTPSDEKLSIVKNNEDFIDAPYIYKTQLQIYAQKRNLSLPVYSSVHEGLPHAPRFKVMVRVVGQTFESPGFFHTLREAENAAAKVAFSSLPKDGTQQDGCGVYKNLLWDLAHKEGLAVPFYTTTESRASSHVPMFTSTVHVEGDDFHGLEAKTKKQAEINAAKEAYFFLKERKLRQNPVPLCQSSNAQVVVDPTYSSSDNTTLANLLQKLNVKDEDQGADPNLDLWADSDEIVAKRQKVSVDPLSLSTLKPGQLRRNPVPLCQNDNAQVVSDRTSSIIDTNMEANVLRKLNVKDEDSDKIFGNGEKVAVDPSTLSPLNPGSSEPENSRSHSPNITHESKRVPVPQVSSAQAGSSSPTTVLENCHHVNTKHSASDLPAAPSTFLCNRVRVYSHKPELKLPKGVTFLPISDDKWVAVHVEFPNEQA